MACAPAAQPCLAASASSRAASVSPPSGPPPRRKAPGKRGPSPIPRRMTQAEIFPCRFPGRVKAAFTSPKRPHAKACLSCSRLAQERARHGRQKKASSPVCQKLTQRTAPETAEKAALPAPLCRASPLPYSKDPKPEGGRTVLRLFCGRFAHCPHARRRNAVEPGLSLFFCRAPDPLRPAPSTVPH